MMQLVIALNAEARPIIDCFNLKEHGSLGLFPIYRGHDISLVISGVGRMAAAAATAYLYSTTGEHSGCGWLNIGVAGHAQWCCGAGVLANRIVDASTLRCWRPYQIHNIPIASAPLITVDSPETEYPEEMIYDMEAAGFYFVASRCTASELVQCYKVISDNRYTSTATVTPNRVRQLISDRLADIDTLMQRIADQIR